MRVLHYWYLEINLEICLKTRKFHELTRRQLERLVVDFQRWFMQWWYSFKGGGGGILESHSKIVIIYVSIQADGSIGKQVDRSTTIKTRRPVRCQPNDFSICRSAAIDLLNLTFSNHPIYFIFIFQFVKTLKNYFSIFSIINHTCIITIINLFSGYIEFWRNVKPNIWYIYNSFVSLRKYFWHLS